MNILSIDTSSNICGVSILNNTKLICNLDTNTNKTHSENLMPMIELALKKSNLSLKDINLLICDIGPGSFTGIRIGVSTVKAFMDSLNIPCVPVTSLEALAYNVKLEFGENYNGLVCSIIDCKHSNCYFALFNFDNGICSQIIEPKTDSIDNALEIIKKENKLSNKIVFVGDGCLLHKDLIKNSFSNAVFLEEKNNMLNSYTLALAGSNKSSTTNSSEILPLYIKKPQAQMSITQ